MSSQYITPFGFAVCKENSKHQTAGSEDQRIRRSEGHRAKGSATRSFVKRKEGKDTNGEILLAGIPGDEIILEDKESLLPDDTSNKTRFCCASSMSSVVRIDDENKQKKKKEKEGERRRKRPCL